MKTECFGVIPVRKKEGALEVFLVLHRSGNYWGFPKGKKSGKESPRETAIRELKEETGLNVVKFLPSSPLVDEYSFLRGAIRVDKRVEYFLGTVTGNVSLQDAEIVAGEWFPIEKAIMQLTFPGCRSLCEKLLHEEITEAI